VSPCMQRFFPHIQRRFCVLQTTLNSLYSPYTRKYFPRNLRITERMKNMVIFQKILLSACKENTNNVKNEGKGSRSQLKWSILSFSTRWVWLIQKHFTVPLSFTSYIGKARSTSLKVSV
jgi:hypothetical protein